ncbi:hypothetical protein EKO04_004506 [Ascochyta lentis]|uniref:FAD-binding PCMH-type domain-containing protein n=1 Tax=Ascochyta lentis TaxID=205686 RepID=A0A8H7J6D2_9PLEO|nr:hypothetical protein EKO04_004506 [Ascochyta lentis]
MKTKNRVLFQILTSSIIAAATKSQCKCTPDDECWPSKSDWSALNTTLSGALIQGIPPGSVCYPNEPNYSEEACATIRTQWFDSTFHASNPVSVDYPVWTNNSCNPIYPNGTSLTGDTNAGVNGCSLGAYPAYVVNATTAHQIAEALRWAGSHDIRVIVKATGHSYTGRSIGYGSLSIWTHNLRGIEYLPSFQPADCPVNVQLETVRVAAGHSNGDIQAHLAPHGKVIVSGANPSVGIIGWLTGGGHGYLSSTYGMGSDNLLEANIVLPSGTVVTANPCLNTDIYWAIRGGGGGTYGVITSVVLKIHDTPKTTMHVFALSSLPATPPTSEEFWDTMGWLHTQMQRLKNGGMQGYYYIVGPPQYPTLSFLWAFMLFDKPAGTVEELMAPIETYLTERANLFTWSSNVTQADTYFDIAQRFSNEAVATGGGAYGSRLLSPESLANANRTALALRDVGPSSDADAVNGPTSNPTLIGHMIASSTPPLHFPHSTSLNPAWRTTLVHLVTVQTWRDGAAPSLIDSVRRDVTAKTAVLRALAPDTGAYFNEADASEVDWQGSFFAGNYERLKRVKGEVDPEGLLWCRLCVGSEAFVEREDGRLCRAGYGEEKSELRP